MKISPYLPVEAIVPDLQAVNKLEALQRLVGLMASLGYVTDPQLAERDILLREAKMTTGIGHGIAVPHARSPAATGLHSVLARHPQGLDWAALDGKPVRFILLTLSPPDSPGPHLQFVAAMARLLHDEDVYRRLMEAHSAQEMRDILCPRKKGFFRA